MLLAYGAGQLSILECPDQIKLPKTSKLDGRQIGQVFRALTGHSITEPVPFKVELPPFDLAETICLIDIDGIKEFTSKTLKPKSDITIYGPDNSFEAYTNRLYKDGEPMVTVNLNDGLEAVRRQKPKNFEKSRAPSHATHFSCFSYSSSSRRLVITDTGLVWNTTKIR